MADSIPILRCHNPTCGDDAILRPVGPQKSDISEWECPRCEMRSFYEHEDRRLTPQSTLRTSGKRDSHSSPTDVVIEKDGERHTGSYTVERGVITVRYGFRSKTTQIGNTSVGALARLLLLELLSAHVQRA
jgi:hypothetical protein